MEKVNTILDDICVDIGYSATNALVGWFGGAYLSVPEEISNAHPIAKAIGVRPAFRLAATWGGKRLWIPLAHAHGVDRRDRKIVDMLNSGSSCVEVAEQMGLTARRIQQILFRLKVAGLTDFLEKTALENGGQNV